MKLQRHEKILAAATGGLIVLAGAWFLLQGGDSRSLAKLRDDHTRLSAEVANKEKMLDAAARDGRRLADWQRRALPSDPAIARSLYQNWLRALANRANFRQLNIESKEVETRRDMFTRIAFSLHGRVGLADLTEFLYKFYSAGHLHQIRQMDIKPLENSRDLDVNLSIEATSLPSADRKDTLSNEPGHGLRFAQLADYRDPIVRRNLFAAYTRTPTREVGIDPAEYTFVTGFTEVDGTRQVWILDRIAGKTWMLSEGGEFQIGRVRGTVRTIGPAHDVVVDFDGHRRHLRDGDNLRGGIEVRE